MLLRPQFLLKKTMQQIPSLEDSVRFLIGHKTRGEIAWPDWCFIPVQCWTLLALKFPDRIPALEHEILPASLAAIAAWNYTKGIYRIEPHLLEALYDSPPSGDLPSQVLMNLPEWSMYIDLSAKTPPQSSMTYLGRSAKLQGFFAYLDYNLDAHDCCLWMVLDYGPGIPLFPLQLQLAEKLSLEESFLAGLSNSIPERMQNFAAKIIGGEAFKITDKIVQPLSVLTFLCSDKPEIAPEKPLAHTNHQRKTLSRKKGFGLKPAPQCTIYNAGASLGRDLASQEKVISSSSSSRTVATHLRRGHWHGFWTGPRNDDSQRRFVYHFLPPNIINPQPDKKL